MQMVTLILLFSCILTIIAKNYECEPCRCLQTNEKLIGQCLTSSSSFEPKIYSIPMGLDKNIQQLLIRGQHIEVLYTSSFEYLPHLKQLDMYKNNVSIIEDYAFKNLTKLHKLILSYNKLSALPTKIFRDTPEISSIYLDHNKIQIIQKDLFSHLYNLHDIHLQNNNLLSVQDYSFATVPLLSHINLSNNNFTYISQKIFSSLNSILKVHLANNPWNCDKHLCEIMHTTITHSWDKFSTPACFTPENKQGRSWRDVKNNYLPTITILTNKNTEEYNTTLQCDICGAKKIIWRNINHENEITRSVEIINTYSATSMLTIENENKSGIYSCHVNNCLLCDEATIDLTISKNYLPSGIKSSEIKIMKPSTVLVEHTVDFTAEQYISKNEKDYGNTSSSITHIMNENVTMPTLQNSKLLGVTTSHTSSRQIFQNNTGTILGEINVIYLAIFVIILLCVLLILISLHFRTKYKSMKKHFENNDKDAESASKNHIFTHGRAQEEDITNNDRSMTTQNLFWAQQPEKISETNFNNNIARYQGNMDAYRSYSTRETSSIRNNSYSQGFTTRSSNSNQYNGSTQTNNQESRGQNIDSNDTENVDCETNTKQLSETIRSNRQQARQIYRKQNIAHTNIQQGQNEIIGLLQLCEESNHENEQQNEHLMWTRYYDDEITD